jgi:hypothetical protein
MDRQRIKNEIDVPQLVESPEYVDAWQVKNYQSAVLWVNCRNSLS